MAILDVTDSSLLLKLRFVVYTTLVILSFFIFVSIGVVMDKFHGFCPLYASYRIAWNVYSSSRCHYPMVVAILFQLIYLLFRLVIMVLFYLGKIPTEMFLMSDKMEIIYVLVDALAFLLTFIGACVLSAGTNYACSQFHSCAIFDWFSAASVAQASAWVSTFFWLFIAVWGILFVWKTGKIPFPNREKNSSTKGEGAT